MMAPLEAFMAKHRTVVAIAVFLTVLAHPFAQSSSWRPTIAAQHGMVAAGHPLAAEAGLRILKAGGNAVDAAIATWAVQGEVEPGMRSEEHTSELQSQSNLVCRLLLEKKKKKMQSQ